MNKYYNDESAHSMLMYWWHGVIVDEKYWAGCKKNDKGNEHSTIHYSDKPEESPKKGWGKRYKVAIVGRHYAVKENPDEADLLEMAEVVYPVTAGSGLGGTKQTSALRQGTHVIGFYADGKEGRNPVILGAFGVNEQNEPSIYQGDPPQFFQQRTANRGQCGNKKVPEKDQSLEKGKICIESNCSPLVATVKLKTQSQDGGQTSLIKPPMKCESPSGIIDDIKFLLNKMSYYVNIAKKGGSDLITSAQGIIKSITREISGLTNTLMDRMRGYVMNLINAGISGVMNILPPFLRPSANFEAQRALGGLSLAFNDIKDRVFGVVKNLGKQFIDNYVNAPLCAASSFTGALIGNLLGEVNGAVDTAVGSINKFLSIGGGFANSALNVLDFALDILELFGGDKETSKCPDTKQWSFWNGPREVESNIREGASRLVKNILDEVETVLPGSQRGAAANPCNSRQVPCGPPKVQVTGGGGSGANANIVVSATGKILGLDFSVFGSGYTSSPQIRIVDSCGIGGGAYIEPIMEPTGTFNEYNEEILALTGAVVLDSGDQYVPVKNGMTGGEGFIFSQPSDTIHFKTGTTQTINGREVNGTGYEVYECGTTVNLVIGDEVYLPEGTTGEIYDEEGTVVQTLEGLGHEVSIVIEANGTFTSPCVPENVPTVPPIEYPLEVGETIELEPTELPTESTIGIPNLEQSGQPQTVPGVLFTSGDIIPAKYIKSPVSNAAASEYEGDADVRIQPVIIENFLPNSYPIVPTIERVIIKNPGYNYTADDVLTISDNKGAELEFSVNGRGEVTEVRVIEGGLGFNDVPEITLQSSTGFNFEAVVVLKFTSAYDIDLNNVEIPEGSQVISVIDTVGKYPEISQGNNEEQVQ